MPANSDPDAQEVWRRNNTIIENMAGPYTRPPATLYRIRQVTPDCAWDVLIHVRTTPSVVPDFKWRATLHGRFPAYGLLCKVAQEVGSRAPSGLPTSSGQVFVTDKTGRPISDGNGALSLVTSGVVKGAEPQRVAVVLHANVTYSVEDMKMMTGPPSASPSQ